MKRLLILFRLGLVLFALLLCPGFAATEGSIEITKSPNEPITLQKALSWALTKNPQLDVFSLEQRVQEARALQSGLLPNPELEILVEDVAGSGNFSGFGGSQTTLQLSQVIELGGKRTARLRANDLKGKLAGWDYETKRMDVLTEVAKSYADVLKAQQQVLLAKSLTGLGEQFLNAVDERVKAGKVPALEKTKAEISLSSIGIQLAQEKRKLKVARRNLSSLWGDTEPQFESALGDFFAIAPVPPLKQLMPRLTDNPDLKRWALELEQRQAVVDNELSKRIPDLKFLGGFRNKESTDDNTLVFGISIPLQLFDRNQGSISEARHNLAKANAQKKVTEIKVTKKLLSAYDTVDFTYSQVLAIKTKILAGTKSAFDRINEGYRFGKFDYLDVLDSQKIFFATQSQYLSALEEHHKAVADMERLIGEPLALVNHALDKPEEGKRP